MFLAACLFWNVVYEDMGKDPGNFDANANAVNSDIFGLIVFAGLCAANVLTRRECAPKDRACLARGHVHGAAESSCTHGATAVAMRETGRRVDGQTGRRVSTAAWGWAAWFCCTPCHRRTAQASDTPHVCVHGRACMRVCSAQRAHAFVCA